MSNFGSAMDLSARSGGGQGDLVTGWLVPADENLLRRYLELSERVPVVLLMVDSSPESTTLAATLAQIIESGQGRLAGITVSIESSPQLAQALAVTQAPAALGILAGQPTPLFKGNPDQQQLAAVLSQLLQAAAQNGINGSVSIGQAAQQKQLSPQHQAAFDAIDRGDLSSAKELYQKLLVEYPNDQDAKAGLAQVELMIRLSAAPQGENGELFAGADRLLVGGDAPGAFNLLLDDFAISKNDEVRARLLELFTLVGDSEPEVLAARRRLTSLMF